MPLPTKRGVKVISSLFGFAAVERQTIKRKTLKIWVKFGVAAAGPWGEGRDLRQRRDPQYGAPFVPRVPMSHDRGHYHGTVSDGFYDSEKPKTPNRK